MNPFLISTSSVATVVSEVAAWGAKDVETGGFLLSDHDGAITLVALSGAAGIQRRRAQLVVSGRALAVLFGYADAHGYAVRAQFHSHSGRAFLSRSDLRHGFSVEGFVTTVLPSYAAPPVDPRAWSWWAYLGGWARIAPPVISPGATPVVRFDEDGVHET
jgi:hypothetical protein